MSTRNYYSIDQLACIEILEAFGIDPNNVRVEGTNESGYSRYSRDENGRKIFDGDRAWAAQHEWPKGFPVKTFMDHLERWRGSV